MNVRRLTVWDRAEKIEQSLFYFLVVVCVYVSVCAREMGKRFLLCRSKVHPSNMSKWEFHFHCYAIHEEKRETEFSGSFKGIVFLFADYILVRVNRIWWHMCATVNFIQNENTVVFLQSIYEWVNVLYWGKFSSEFALLYIITY